MGNHHSRYRPSTISSTDATASADSCPPDPVGEPDPAPPAQPEVEIQRPKPKQERKPQHFTSVGSLGRVLGRAVEDVREKYEFGRELGRGQFGVTYLVTEKSTGLHFACKSIAGRKISCADDIEDVQREIKLMEHLAGNRNIVELHTAFEDRNSVNLIMELCEGGELFDRIIAKGHYSERAAASLFREIANVVHYCHSMGVMHRDLKPENFLFLHQGDDSPLKLTDFGLSTFFKPGDKFRDFVGSAYYIAPEVLNRNYGAEVDIWSAGVILYILLSGIPPFWGGNDNEIFESILEGDVDFISNPWPSISSGAKDLVSMMLHKNPKKRLSAAQVLDHPWLREEGVAPDRALDNTVITRMKQFRAINKLKKVALKVVAKELSAKEIMSLKEAFKSIDTDNSGTITFEELRAGLPKLGNKISGSEIMQLMEAADLDGNGSIDYLEFLSAAIHMNKLVKEEYIFKAFQFFDEDGSGYITMAELERALEKYDVADKETVREIIADIDKDHDGRINYQEFLAMMRGTTDAEGQRKT